jgi:hypothetical protein
VVFSEKERPLIDSSVFGHIMEISPEEAFSLLVKWKAEGRDISALLWNHHPPTSSLVSSEVLGKIDQANLIGIVEIAADNCRLTLNLIEATQCSYEDPQSARVVDSFQNPQLREMCEGVIIIEFEGCCVDIRALRTRDERITPL